VKCPTGWHLTHSLNHWANEFTTKDYIQKIINPYLMKKHEELHLASNHCALCIFDNFKGQLTDDMLQLLEDSFIDVFVPPNCTNRLQPLDLSVNKSAKDFLKRKFWEWYSDEIINQKEEGSTLRPVTFPMHVMKPLGLQWLKDFYAYMKNNADIV